ncbi:MAG: hypothetical protein A2513_07810 [Sulfurimonas sp. RIFOXYD12_FULL_33_39]|uniref:hypothetical protein n=1 Tax=unclassified Sulfurimonas TaxID=2623549 RepID=UPI0008AFBC28|nr:MULTISPECIES: hypothetical protein [unclassified Sulfurimonas]OHE06516.1 MAG: hypothetical protein A3G74_01985 [Sulfurimonas sp. RIFCSPLOWO2_12_FULL_34_6]OHE09998.1 MAG: hypothetical protein A2513_07810 [Sulfurimonas sp. RIFOXYD12_FULL_33_39]OHE14782.1 MAG: hypothetical protein A2530_02670 [Sulfurimonas sp. RIFOXYD2_FULL_34_21]DAB28835.1 MAG TPA: hypothetical protein CFH78_00340 [Sulfurimonas sp. UBA10385]
MKEKIKAKAKEIATNPNTKKALLSMKPEKNFWGISGVVLFLILPEIVAYIWGADITAYANEQLKISDDFLEIKYYEMLVMLFEEGMSYLNLAIGIALLVWLFF